MSEKLIIRTWKDEEYRNSLSEVERAKLPQNPAGLAIELTDAELDNAAGGLRKWVHRFNRFNQRGPEGL